MKEDIPIFSASCEAASNFYSVLWKCSRRKLRRKTRYIKCFRASFSDLIYLRKIAFFCGKRKYNENQIKSITETKERLHPLWSQSNCTSGNATGFFSRENESRGWSRINKCITPSKNVYSKAEPRQQIPILTCIVCSLERFRNQQMRFINLSFWLLASCLWSGLSIHFPSLSHLLPPYSLHVVPLVIRYHL